MRNSVAVGTAERGLSPSRMSCPWKLFSPHQVVPSICVVELHSSDALTLPQFRAHGAVSCPVPWRGGGMPPLPPEWGGSSTPAVCQLLLPTRRSCIQGGTCRTLSAPLPHLQLVRYLLHQFLLVCRHQGAGRPVMDKDTPVDPLEVCHLQKLCYQSQDPFGYRA